MIASILFKRTFDSKNLAFVSTRKRLLEIAAQHFATNGYHGTSVRNITEQAQVNLAAVNYHFRNKEFLYCEVLSTALQPLNRTRLQKLECAVELAGDCPVPLSLIIGIFVEPLFELCRTADQPSDFLARLIGRSITEPLPFIQNFLKTNQQGVTARFAQSMRRHVPGISASEFMWRLSFVMGALHHTLATMYCMRELTQGLCPNNEVDQATVHFVRFAVNTLRATDTAA